MNVYFTSNRYFNVFNNVYRTILEQFYSGFRKNRRHFSRCSGAEDRGRGFHSGWVFVFTIFLSFLVVCPYRSPHRASDSKLSSWFRLLSHTPDNDRYS